MRRLGLSHHSPVDFATTTKERESRFTSQGEAMRKISDISNEVSYTDIQIERNEREPPMKMNRTKMFGAAAIIAAAALVATPLAATAAESTVSAATEPAFGFYN